MARIRIALNADRAPDLYEHDLAVEAKEKGLALYRWHNRGELDQKALDTLVAKGWSLRLAEDDDSDDDDGSYHSRRSRQWLWTRDGSILAVRYDTRLVAVNCTSTDPEVVRTVREANLLRAASPMYGRLHVMSNAHGELGLNEVGHVREPVVRDNYAAGVLVDYDKAQRDLATGAGGRLVLLIGPPGTGKSYLVRGLVQGVDAKHVVVPEALFGKLSDPAVLGVLADEAQKDRPIVLILEDADTAMMPRGADNLGLLSTLLNVTDGVLGSALNLRVVATTNAKKIDLDPALLRPGRLSVRIDVGPLDAEHAGRVFERLTGGGQWSGGSATLAEVYAASAELHAPERSAAASTA